mgnify:FL=1
MKNIYLNYEFNDISSVIINDDFFKNRFILHKIIKENNNKVSMIIYYTKMDKICFLKVKNANNFSTEVYEILKNNDHPNIEKVFDVIKNNNFIYILTEYIPGVNLDEYRQNNKNKIDKKFVKKTINQTFEALNFIHKLNIIHCDIKLDNIIITNDENIKIIDFDLAAKCNTYICSKCRFGSENYIAPESYDIHIYSKRSDIWSFGILLYKLLLDKFPYKSKLSKSCHFYVRNNPKLLNLDELDTLNESYGHDIVLFIKKMLNFIDEYRPLEANI